MIRQSPRSRTSALVIVLVLLVVAGGSSAGGGAVSAAPEDPKVSGRWSTPFWEGGGRAYDPPSLEKSKEFPTAVSAVVLPDGRLLYWNGLEGTENADLFIGNFDYTYAVENSRARILDLRGATPRWTLPRYERGTTDEAQDIPAGASRDLFCADQKLLYDGTVLLAGGNEARIEGVVPELHGDDETRIFDPRTDAFRSVEAMREPRWYPALVTLPDGRVMVMSGVRRVLASPSNPEPSFHQVRLTEIYDPSTGRWRQAGVSEWSFPLYPRLHLLPDGTVFYGGVGQLWTPFGATLDQATWGFQRAYDPATRTWSMVGHTRYGARSSASSTLLRLEPPYDRAEILIAGGTVGYSPGTWAATTLSEVVRWTPDGIVNLGDFKDPVAGLAGDLTQLRNRRWYGTTVMLPTGEVLMVNGGDADDVMYPGSAAAVRTAELYDPKTGTWREVGRGSRDRVYHNSAVLLPDGRVLVGGHAPLPAHNARHDHPVTRSNNYRDSTFEIFEPPYLFRGRRPVVERVAAMRAGRALELTMGPGTRAGDISEVVLVRMSANTHTVDADMRAVKLAHRVRGGAVVAGLPNRGDGRILPPGPYYVFAMRDTPDGAVPSVAKIVLIQPGGRSGSVVMRPA